MSDQLLQALERYFAEFPPAIAAAIHQELLKANGLPGLLQRLGLAQTGAPTEQYAMLIRHLRREGLRPLENLIGHSLTSAPSRDAYEEALDATRRLDAERTRVQSPGPEVKKYQVPSLPETTTPRSGSGTTRIPLVASPKPAAGTPAPQPAPAAPTTAAGQRAQFPSGPLVPGTPPEPGTFDAKTPSWDASKPYDPKGIWPAVERRSGVERRKGPRRNEVEITYRNRRYGKDRRAETERRKNWPKGGHQS